MLRAIFVTCSLPHGGAERHAVAVMNRLAERGHECHAVYIKDRWGDRVGGLRLPGTLRCLYAGRYLDRRALGEFAAHIRHLAPSVIVAANSYALMYAWLALRLARWRAALVQTFHSTRLLTLKESAKMLLERFFFWGADCTVFVCETQKHYWKRRGVFSRRNEVIYNGVDTEAFRDSWSAEERDRVRASLGFTDRDFVVGISAYLRPEKNHVQLVDAVSLLKRRGLPVRALMIGDGVMRPAVEARARALGVTGDILITGVKEEVRPYIAACDAMAMCSLSETFSLAAIEAMALGRAVVHADVGGASEMIFPGWNGFLFPVGDTEAFAGKLALLADPALRARFGKQARATVETLFSEKVMVDRYESVLLELCRGYEDAKAAVAR